MLVLLVCGSLGIRQTGLFKSRECAGECIGGNSGCIWEKGCKRDAKASGSTVTRVATSSSLAVEVAPPSLAANVQAFRLRGKSSISPTFDVFLKDFHFHTYCFLPCSYIDA